MPEYQSRTNNKRKLEAWQLLDETADELAQLTRGTFAAAYDALSGDPVLTLRVETMGTFIIAERGDFLFQSSAGTWHKASAEWFTQHYIPVEDPPTGQPLQHMPDFPRRI